jgi:hypothetical protein
MCLKKYTMQLCKLNAMCKIKCIVSKQFLHNKKTHFQQKNSKTNMDNKKIHQQTKIEKTNLTF